MTPTLLRIDDLPEGAVLALAARPVDLLVHAGGALARLARRGDPVVLVVPAGGEGEESVAREAEVRAATRALGIEDLRWSSVAAESLAGDHGLVARLRELASEVAPEIATVLGPEPGGSDEATRVVAAAAAALARQRGARLLLHGTPGSTPTGMLLDVSAVAPEKETALERLGRRDGVELDVARARASGLEGLERAEAVRPVQPAGAAEALRRAAGVAASRVTAVLSTWNKCDEVLENLAALEAQTVPFARVVVVDNASSDATMARVRAEFPDAQLVVMPHSDYGACETFNIGFACADTELVAILDDDVVLPPTWVERATARLDREPDTTAIVSTKVVEPGMPESYANAPEVNTERYMSTFRGCASLARKQAIADCGYYDERLFIYGNERDLTCRLLNRGWRVLQYPGTHAFHKTPFGVQMGRRSLYYHARNAWLVQLKYAPLGALLRMPLLVVGRVLFRSRKKEEEGTVAVATGTIGIGAAVRGTPGAWRVLVRAAWSVLWNIPYCLKHREPCRAPDYELPIE